MLILRGHRDAVRCLSYSPDGRILASGSEDETVRLWDLASHVPAVLKHESSVETLAFPPRGEMLVTGTAVGEVLAWDMLRRRPRFHIRGHTGGVRGLGFAGDGKTLATTGWDRGIILWEWPTFKKRTQLPEDIRATVLCFAPSESVMAVGYEDGAIRLFEPSFAVLLSSQSGTSPIHCLSWSPDGRLLASGHADGSILLREETQLYASLPGHSWTVYSLAFTPDGRTLVSGSADGTVRLWDVVSGCERRCYRWHTSWVTCLAVAPDGMTAAAGSADHTIVVWDLDDG